MTSHKEALTHLAIGGVLITISFLIFIAMLGPLNTSINSYATSTPTPDATGVTLLKLVPTVLIAGSLIVGVVFLVQGARGLGAASSKA